jgi:hypothetical protein
MKLAVCGQVLLEGKTFAPIDPDESSFVLEDDPVEGGRRLSATLAKKRSTMGSAHWKCVVVGEPEIDVEEFAKLCQVMPDGESANAALTMQGNGHRMMLTPSRR